MAIFNKSNYTLSEYVTKDSITLIYPEEIWALSTGGLKIANIKNIYDMAGNMAEWTMEGSGTGARVTRGGFFDQNGCSGYYTAYRRYAISPSSVAMDVGFRVSLYIKK